MRGGYGGQPEWNPYEKGNITGINYLSDRPNDSEWEYFGSRFMSV